MPFSRSRSMESITRSATSWLARNTPDCQSIASTSVVLPWSTWATMATFRMSSRVRMVIVGASTVAEGLGGHLEVLDHRLPDLGRRIGVVDGRAHVAQPAIALVRSDLEREMTHAQPRGAALTLVVIGAAPVHRQEQGQVSPGRREVLLGVH